MFVDYLSQKKNSDVEYSTALDYGIAVGFNDSGNADRHVAKQVSYILDTEDISSDNSSSSHMNQDRRRSINGISAMMNNVFKDSDIEIERATIADRAFQYIFDEA